MNRWGLALLLAAAPAVAQVPPELPAMIERTAWDPHWSQRHEASIPADKGQRTRILIHHTVDVPPKILLSADADPEASAAAGAREMRQVLRVHLEQGWSDVVYHYAIDPQGRIYKGRPVKGLAKGPSGGTINIGLMGNFERQGIENLPKDDGGAPKQLKSLEALAAWLAYTHRIDPRRIVGHHEGARDSCPGERLTGPLREMRLRLMDKLKGLQAYSPTERPLDMKRTGKTFTARSGRLSETLKEPTVSNLRAFFDGDGWNRDSIPESRAWVPALPLTPALSARPAPKLTTRPLDYDGGPGGSDDTAPRNRRTTPGSIGSADLTAQIDDGKFRLPFKSQNWPRVSRNGYFGAPRSYGGHDGIDFPVPPGTEVYASRAGKVAYIVTSYDKTKMRTRAGHKGYGNRVVVEHPDGSETWYAHLSKVLAEVGDDVEPYDASRSDNKPLGLSGSTGHASGPHLHFMVVKADGETRNPVVALGHVSEPVYASKRRKRN